nr:uncharacterized protein CI109_000179 [Kwoniella shandongensis]KAA5531338.1 hypothetical protein CI109_000179 [Kwoniella shandongensis]
MSKPAPRIQSRPSTSTQPSRPMAPRPSSTASTPIPRPAVSATPSTSASGKIAIPRTAPAASASASTARPPPVSRTSSSSASTATTSAGAAASVVPGKDTSSSAGKIFAKPSKEWVLPERAKPGRKVSAEEPDNKRQSQNRLSQRAHRARRTDYIQTLEERLRQYEANEIHSNVRLQEVARALKADNERLKAEVTALQTTCMEYNGERDVWELERRTMKDTLREMRIELEAMRAGRGIDTIVRMEVDQSTIDSLVPGPSIPRRQSNTVQITATTRNAVTLQACPICPDPDPDCPCQQPQQQQTYSQDLTLASSSHDHHHDHSHGSSTCGLCHSTEECLCRVVEEDIKPDISSSPSNTFKSDEGCGLCTGGGFCACRAGLSESPRISNGSQTLSAPAEVSGVVRAPVAALPLRLRSKNSGLSKAPIWAINATPLPAVARSPEAVCTGDPSNCDACRNDSFGREFCQHLFEATDSSTDFKPCSTCPGNCMNIKSLLSPSPEHANHASSSTAPSTSSSHLRTPPSVNAEDEMPLAPLQMACCGNPELCGGHHGGGGGCTGDVVAIGGSSGLDDSSSSVQAREVQDEIDHSTLRPDQAWKQLKAHPNAKFASLALLADVVARRTKCLGPRVEMSPLPPSPVPAPATPAPATSTIRASSVTSNATMTAQARKRQFEIETSGLRDALKLLDKATPAPSSPIEAERELKRRRVDL